MTFHDGDLGGMKSCGSSTAHRSTVTKEQPMLPAEAISDLGSTLSDLQVDPTVVAQTTEALTKAFEALGEYPFDIIGTIQQTSFGDNSTATNLSYHHGRAHQVMVDTIEGTKTDILKLTQNLKLAVQLLQDTDTNSGADIAKTNQVLESLTYLDDHSYGDNANNRSRNDPNRYNGGDH